MSDENHRQAGLSSFDSIDPNARFNDVRDYLGGLFGRIRNTLSDIGFDTTWWGKSPFEVEPAGDIWVYQYVVAYSKGKLGDRYQFGGSKGNRSTRRGSPSPELQFKTGIYVVGEPTDDLERRIRGVDNPRTRTLFNTREYESYLDGFLFTERREYVQRERVSAREVDQKGYGLGVPWFEVEAYDEDGRLEGYADGFFDPFTTETETITTTTGAPEPEQEVWRVQTGLNEARGAGGQWEIGPDPNTGARERAKRIRGKTVHVGPFDVGQVTKRGTTWLRREYAGAGDYADKSTITSTSGIPAQALQKGAKLYKYRETEDAIYLSTTKPRTGFRPLSSEDISADAVGVETTSEEVTSILLDDDEPTTFTVESDESDGRLLGLYDPPVVRDIANGTVVV